MARALSTVFLAGALAAPLTAAPLAECTEGPGEILVRIGACESLLPGLEGASVATRIAVYAAYGDLLVTAGRADEAVAWLSRALELAPDHARALLRRSVALNDLGRDEAALADLTRLTALRPQDGYAFYRLGYTLDELGRFQAALEALERAAVLEPEYFWARFERARALEGLERWQEAGAAARAALELRPLMTGAHRRALRVFRAAGDMDRAAYHARILVTLDPNRRDVQAWLDRYLAESAPPLAPDPPPTPWRPPPEGREIRYLKILSDDFPPDLSDEVIGEFLTWLLPPASYPKPDNALVYRQSFRPAEREGFIPIRIVEARQGPLKAPPREGPARWRGLMRLEQKSRRPGPPVIAPVWGDTSPAQAWPLEDGKQVRGRAEYVALCATGKGLPNILAGCRPGVETVPLGQAEWSLSVIREQIHVPAGWFDTWRLNFSLEGRLEILGRERPLRLQGQYWLAPALDTWVAARTDLDGRFALTQALEVLR